MKPMRTYRTGSDAFRDEHGTSYGSCTVRTDECIDKLGPDREENYFEKYGKRPGPGEQLCETDEAMLRGCSGTTCRNPEHVDITTFEKASKRLVRIIRQINNRNKV